MKTEPFTLSAHFWHQPSAEQTLQRAAALSRTPHSLLLTGPEGTGKWAAALWIARSQLCRNRSSGLPCGDCRDCSRVTTLSHPDLHLLFPFPSRTKEDRDDSEDPKSEPGETEFRDQKLADPFAVVRFAKKPVIKLDRIRGLIRELNKTSVEGGAKVVIIQSVDQTKDDDSQSVLLKTIEEPPPDTYFVLSSSAPDRLLPTIRSRCQTVRFGPVDDRTIAERLVSELQVPPSEAETIARVSGGGWGQARRLASQEYQAWRELAGEFWKGAFRVSAPQLLTQIESTFRAGRKTVGFDALLQAFDVWSLCLWRDCLEHVEHDAPHGVPRVDLETIWSCWRILQLGRASLYVNVSDRHAIAGTFFALRRRMGVT